MSNLVRSSIFCVLCCVQVLYQLLFKYRRMVMRQVVILLRY